MKKIVDMARSEGKVLGTFTDTPEAARRWKNAGVQYLSYSVDVGIFTSACNDLVADLSDL